MSLVFWFRKGLRLSDNPALVASLKIKGPKRLFPIFILDPWFVKHGNVGVNRWGFLCDSLRDLDTSLRKLGSRLIVLRGTPTEIFPQLLKDWDVKVLAFEKDSEPYCRERDKSVIDIAKSQGVTVVAEVGHTLHDIEKYISTAGKAPTTYRSFENVFHKMGAVAAPVDAPINLPDFDEKTQLSHEGKKWGSTWEVPTLQDLGYDPVLHTTPFKGGETEGLARMENFLSQTARVANFEKPKTLPTALEPDTTALSPYLKFGCVSVRAFYHKVLEVYKGRKHTQPPVSLVGQVIWREFYYVIAFDTPNFDRMVGNPICRQIPWETDVKTEASLLSAWKEGKTGYPWIDACMRQLKQQGWIHHLARHAVACFLTRGDCWVSWEKGRDVFDNLLIDADWALNAGNWMWLSASAFYHQYWRVYSPVSFGRNTDKEGKFVKHFVPELKNFPAKFIYEPWKASKAQQKQWGCVVGEGYPERIVDHDVVRQVNMDRMKAAYATDTVPAPKSKEPPAKKQKLSAKASKSKQETISAAFGKSTGRKK